MAEKFKDRLTVGQRVKFRRSHDKNVQMTGMITRIHPGADDCVDVETEADGKICEVSGTETAHAGDCKVIEDARESKASDGAESGESAPEKPGRLRRFANAMRE